MRNLSLVIRTFNESSWIQFCLDSILYQKNVNIVDSVFIIDSQSTDSTISLIENYFDNLPLKIINYTGKYLPGKSINLGLKEVLKRKKVDYCIILSAHCILSDSVSLFNLVNSIENTEKCRSGFGRQLPGVFR